jgi:FkbM family methyltransferase
MLSRLSLYLFKKAIISKIKTLLKVFVRKSNYVEVNIATILDIAVSKKKIENFLQIGSNDGEKNDPIWPLLKKYILKGILVEPFENNFIKLVSNYSSQIPYSSTFFFEQVGISSENQIQEFYYVKDIKQFEPDWYDQIGSFDKATFFKNIDVVPALSDRVGIKSIECVTVDQILTKHSFTKIDLIHIDAEGYDYKILKSIDFKKWQPKFLLFETDWMTNYEVKDLERFLRNEGYSLYYEGIDCIAIKR